MPKLKVGHSMVRSSIRYFAAALVTVLMLPSDAAIAADGIPLIKSYVAADKEASTFSKTELKRIADVRASRSAGRVSITSIDRNAFLSTILTINLPSGEVLTFTKLREEQVDPTNAKPANPKDLQYVWVGTTASGGQAVFTVSPDGTSITGTISERGKDFFLSTLNSKTQYLMEIDNTARQTLDDTPGRQAK
jgi:hypothetical protein